MNAGNPRSLKGHTLRISRLLRPRRISWFLGGVFVGAAQLWLVAGAADAQASRAEGTLDRAEVEPLYDDEAPADLYLGEEGLRKREALLLYYRGSCLDESDIPARLNFFKRVIELDPSNIVLAMETATHCAAQGEFSKAQSILEESLSQNQDNRDAYLNLSRYCERYHGEDGEMQAQALAYAEQAVDKFPTDQVAVEHLARLLLDREEESRAQEVLEQALAREVRDGDYWLAMGGIARDIWPMDREENRARVMGIYEKALHADPGNLDTAERVAEFYRMVGNVARAIQIYQVLVQRSPDRLGSRESLAELFWEAGQVQEAVAGLEALVQINPEAFDVHRKLSAMYLAMKDIARSIGHCEQIVESGSAEISDFIRLAELQRFADRLGGALQTLRAGAALFPNAPQLSFSLGRLFLDLDRFTDAYAAFRAAETQAEAEEPLFLDEGFYFQYAMSAERAGDFDRAEELFTKAIDLVPAEAEEEKAKSLNYLGYMWLEREKNLDEAGEMIKKANQLAPDNAAYLDSLGWFYHLKGDYGKAIEHLLRAEELTADEPDVVIFEHLARTYHAKGENAEAKRYLERALALDPDAKGLQLLRHSIEKSASAEPGVQAKAIP